MRKIFIPFILLSFIFIMSCNAYSDLSDGLYAVIKTNRGDIVIELFYRETPMTVANFVGLAEGKMNSLVKSGPYFDGLKFHRVVKDFVIQGGDPKGDGTGGPGYEFPEEIVQGLTFNAPGTLGMANAGPGTNGSQFFITLSATPHLNGSYTVFGRVVRGFDVVQNIQQGDTMKSVKILRIGKEAQGFQADRASFEKFKQRQLERIKKEKETKYMEIISKIESRWPHAIVTDSGIRYFISKEGTGRKPVKGQVVSVHYTGYFLDGTQFDSSVERNKPFEFKVGIGQVIEGWDISVLDMKIGEKRTIIIPPELGYGSRGAGGVIPPDTWIIFDVELLNIK